MAKIQVCGPSARGRPGRLPPAPSCSWCRALRLCSASAPRPGPATPLHAPFSLGFRCLALRVRGQLVWLKAKVVFYFIFYFLVFLPFLWPFPRHMEVPRLGIESEL